MLKYPNNRKPGQRPVFFRVSCHSVAILAAVSLLTLEPRTAIASTAVSNTNAPVQDLMMQERSFSCGAAALATYITYWLGGRETEASLLKLLFANISPEERASVERAGLSPKHLSLIAKKLGFRETWAEVYADDLRGVHPPVIAFLNFDGRKHWSIFKGIYEDYAYLGDPILGNIKIEIDEFRRLWAIENNRQTGLMWAIERPNRQNLGVKSSLNVTAESMPRHKQLAEVRGAARLQPTRAEFSLSATHTNFNRKVTVENNSTDIRVRANTLTTGATLPLSDLWSFQAAADYEKSLVTLQSQNTTSRTSAARWTELSFSLSRIVRGTDNYFGSTNVSTQIPLGVGAHAVGFGGALSTLHGSLSTVSEISFVRRFQPRQPDLEVSSRSRDVLSTSVSLTYSSSHLTEYFISTGLSKYSAQTLSAGRASSDSARTFQIGAATSIFSGTRLQPSISQTWHGSDRDTTFLIRISWDTL